MRGSYTGVAVLTVSRRLSGVELRSIRFWNMRERREGLFLQHNSENPRRKAQRGGGRAGKNEQPRVWHTMIWNLQIIHHETKEQFLYFFYEMAIAARRHFQAAQSGIPTRNKEGSASNINNWYHVLVGRAGRGYYGAQTLPNATICTHSNYMTASVEPKQRTVPPALDATSPHHHAGERSGRQGVASAWSSGFTPCSVAQRQGAAGAEVAASRVAASMPPAQRRALTALLSRQPQRRSGVVWRAY